MWPTDLHAWGTQAITCRRAIWPNYAWAGTGKVAGRPGPPILNPRRSAEPVIAQRAALSVITPRAPKFMAGRVRLFRIFPYAEARDTQMRSQLFVMIGAPKGTRTPVFAVRGRRPGPLDDGSEARAVSIVGDRRSFKRRSWIVSLARELSVLGGTRSVRCIVDFLGLGCGGRSDGRAMRWSAGDMRHRPLSTSSGRTRDPLSPRPACGRRGRGRALPTSARGSNKKKKQSIQALQRPISSAATSSAPPGSFRIIRCRTLFLPVSV